MIVNDKAEEVRPEDVIQYSALFDEARYALKTGDFHKAAVIGKRMLTENARDPHAWVISRLRLINGFRI